MKNEKNIVYTFSNVLDIIENIEDIENQIFGHINKKNIQNIIISSINSKQQLERHLDEFINIVENKLCIIHFTPNEGSLMNYVKYLIENKEKDHLKFFNIYKTEYKKAFIFVMHVKRIFDNELKDLEVKEEKEKKEIKKKFLNETVSNLSEYYQVFIDNLNGDEKLNISDIIKKKKKIYLIYLIL